MRTIALMFAPTLLVPPPPSVGVGQAVSTPRARLRCAAADDVDPRFCLPGANRDIAAEASAAASLFRPSSVPLFQPVGEADAPMRALAMVMLAANGSFHQLVAEIVSNVTSGSRRGTTWLKPLAVRTCANASAAAAAHKFDPLLGWTLLDGDGSDAGPPSEVHVLSPLAPAAFVPTPLLEEVPPALAWVVRSLSEAHAAAAAEEMLEEGLSFGAPPADSACVHAFMAVVAHKLGHVT